MAEDRLCFNNAGILRSGCSVQGYQYMRGADKLALNPVGGQNSTLFEFGPWNGAIFAILSFHD